MELTIEANEESFVIVLQHGGNDVGKVIARACASILFCSGYLTIINRSGGE